MSDRRKEGEEKMAKAIFISADCWLSVFDLITPSQLGLGIAMISHRFDIYVDEHFKTRKWALKFIRIQAKLERMAQRKWKLSIWIEKHCQFRKTKCHTKSSDSNASSSLTSTEMPSFFSAVFALFAACQINLAAIYPTSDRITEFLLCNIWPRAKCLCHAIDAQNFPPFATIRAVISQRLSIASRFQCRWLWLSNPKALLRPFGFSSGHLNRKAFSNNGLTREQLALKRTDDYSNRFLLIRCPIARYKNKWRKWEEEAIGWEIYDQWNQIGFDLYEEEIGDGLLDAPGPSDQQQK